MKAKTDEEIKCHNSRTDPYSYVHLNPVRAKLLKAQEPLQVYRWSSYGEYLKSAKKRPSWLRVDRLFGEMGIPQDSPAGRAQFGRWMEERRRQKSDGSEWRAVRRGWCLGDRAFKKELLDQMHEARGDHYGEELREADTEHAEGVLAAELRRRRWTESQLSSRRKGDPGKVEIAWRLRRETMMTLRWIADRLQMGTWTSVSNYLAQKRKLNEKKQKCQ